MSYIDSIPDPQPTRPEWTVRCCVRGCGREGRADSFLVYGERYYCPAHRLEWEMWKTWVG